MVFVGEVVPVASSDSVPVVIADDDSRRDRELAKSGGDAVATGDILAEVQTDKAVMEMESMEDGYLAKILVPSGDADDIPVGKPVRDVRKRRRRRRV